ncbi:hypothetical protein Ctob_015820, partial [Chrysochromulina tobinii]
RSAAKLEEELQGLTGLLGDGLAAEGDGLAAEGDGLAAEGDGLAAEGEGLRHAKPRAAKRLDLVVDDLDAVLEATARPWNADGHYEHLKLSAVLHVKQYRALKAIATNLLPHVRDSSAVTSADGPGSQPELNEEAARAEPDEHIAAPMSYYNNGPRIFTPSTLRTTKTSSALESFGVSSSAGIPLPLVLNPLHARRGSNLQTNYPRTYGLLRQVEKESVEANFFQTAAAQAAAKAAPYPSTMRTMPDGSIFVARR